MITVDGTDDKAYETYPDDPNDTSGERARRFTIDFNAPGPMWESYVMITFPQALDALTQAQLTALTTPTGSLIPTGDSGHLSIRPDGGEIELVSTLMMLLTQTR